MDAQLKISEVAEKINSIETGGGSSSNSNEVNLSDSYGFDDANQAIIIWPCYDVDGPSYSFSDLGKTKSIANYTLISDNRYIYIALFNASDQKVEIKCTDFLEEEGYSYSGLIDISTPKVYVIKKWNRSEGQEPPK